MMIPRFDEVHVISDLHLGGRPGFQIFNTTAELVRLIDHLRSQPAAQRLALVINGDMVDFLAETPATYFDPLGAVDKLDRIAGDATFSPVWKALQRFVRTPGRTLVINLGNHDLELALPWVREHLLAILAGESLTVRGRITLVFDGTGFRCEVGGAQILCVHGNEVDPWNVADYETIRRIGRDMNAGRAVGPWIPNAGTQLVIDVMNALKRRYPFIDLLKPEAEAVVPTLLALDPQQLGAVRRATATVRRLVWDKVRLMTGFLGDRENMAEAQTGVEVSLWSSTVAGPTGYADSLLDRAEERLDREIDPIDLIGLDQQEEYLGVLGAAWNAVRGETSSEVLRAALEDLAKDRSFEPGQEDGTFTQLDERVGEEIDFLLAGHTHLERVIRRKHGPGYYLNTGTWVGLIKLDTGVLQDPVQFALVFNAFKAGTLEALQGIVTPRPAVASIWMDGRSVRGALRRVSSTGDLLQPVVNEVQRS